METTIQTPSTIRRGGVAHVGHAEHRLAGSKAAALVTAAGTGRFEYDGIAVTRWTGDATRDADGVFVYVRDLENGRVWSAGFQPTAAAADEYSHQFPPGRASYRRVDDGIRVEMDVCLEPERDVELRRVIVTNASGRRRQLEVTSYLEWVLQDAEADASHPAFSKIFVETEIAPERRLILARRRQRCPTQACLAGAHWLACVDGGTGGAVEFETSRLAFLGRGRSLRDPAALEGTRGLAGTAGPVLDPIASLRRAFYLAPDESATIVFALAANYDAAELRTSAEAFSLEEVEQAFARAAQFADVSRDGAPHDGAALDGATRRVDPAHETIRAVGAEYLALREVSTKQAGKSSVRDSLEFDNGIGGFSMAGDEYVMRLRPDASGRLALPPLPWSHVVSNPQAGFIATETGAGYTWTVNSRENRLTHWHNDPIVDPHSEALFLRDRDRKVFWSPTPGPCGPNVTHEVRYGFGYARYDQTSGDFVQRVTKFVPKDEPVKIVHLSLTNNGDAARELDVFFYAALALGNGSRRQSQEVETWFDDESQSVFAKNKVREHAERVAFVTLLTPKGGRPAYTCDREEFLGRHGELSAPQVVRRDQPLSGRTGAGLDACAALQTTLTLTPARSADCWALIGEADSEAEARELIARFANVAALEVALDDIREFWRETLSAVEIKTPSPAMNLMVNGWLPYQNISCRMWGRSAYYQSGGAFGFRDQLQDSAALVYHWPELTRRQILRHAASQFEEGDVLHWWHPPNGQGIRTKFADDLLWLPLIAAEYCDATGDSDLWDQRVPYVTGPQLDDGEAERFLTPTRSGRTDSVYEHACRAIDRSLAVGQHGLPLFGTGDWNDGMNRVGQGGRGESVWMGFFLYHVLERMIPICAARGDNARADRYREHQTRLRAALNGPGWDGQWYRRAFFDDGAPLGTAKADECQIDALVQAWAVLSGAGDADFAKKGMSAVERRLVDEQAGLIRLLDPPFDRMPHDPGYIKGYLPGIRENGGQYTHGVLWFVRALAESGRGSRAVELLDMINPIHHARTSAEVAVYQAEPYVVAADVYSQPPHAGRAGWTWYTGSAGWMWRVAVESILGLAVRDGSELVLDPCISSSWQRCRLRYRLPDGGGEYEITVENPDGRETGVREARLDGDPVRIDDGAARVPLEADGRRHEVTLRL
jgi:cyclic beta-1,2-glucan synthetase